MLKRGRRFARRAKSALSLMSAAALIASCALVVPGPDLVIGTGSPGSTAFPLGGSVCRLFNLDIPHGDRRCAVVPTANTVSMLERLRDGGIDIAIVPSDVLADARTGEGPFSSRHDGPELRVLFTGHADAFTIVVRRELGIHDVSQLRAKRINMGSPGTGERVSMERIMAAVGLTRGDFAQVRELSRAEQHRALCASELDAIVYEVPHPNGMIDDVVRMCGGDLMEVRGPSIDAMLRQHPEYERTVIAGGTYVGLPRDVRTLGVRAVVVTTTQLSDKLAYDITKGVFDHFDDFRRLHPAFAMLSVSDMVGVDRGVPVHGSAARYYRERGWMP